MRRSIVTPPRVDPGPAAASTPGRTPRAANGAEFLAQALIVQALRRASLQHMLKGGAAVAVLSIEDPADAGIVVKAACRLLRAGMRGRHVDWQVVDLVSRRQGRFPQSGIDLLREEGDQETRTLFVVEASARLSEASMAMIDASARLGRPDRELVEAALRSVMGRVSAASLPAGPLPPFPLAAYGSAIRPGAGCARAVARLHRLAEGQTILKTGAASGAGPALADLHGLGAVREWGMALARDLQDFRAGRIRWRDVDGGALLSGPSGSGKTTAALALGRTCGIPVHVHSLAAWQARGYLNDVLKGMRDAFDEARATAPCVLFIDEIDSFGDRGKFDGHNASYNREVVNALLECLDGADRREGVVVLAATNHPDAIDPSLRRPGRLDRHIAIPLPGLDARIGILRHHLGDDLGGCDLAAVAERLEGASAATLEQVVRDARRRARKAGLPIATADLEASLQPPLRLSDAAFERSCMHEAGHLIVGLLLEVEAGSTPLGAFVSREIYGTERGYTRFRREPGFDRTHSSSLADVAILLAGIAAERLVLGQSGFGAGGETNSDLALATRLLAEAELCHGLGEQLVFAASADSPDLFAFLRREPGLRRRLDGLLQSCLDRSTQLLSTDRAALEIVAGELARCGRISADDGRRMLSAHATMGKSSTIAERPLGPENNTRSNGWVD